MWPAVAELVGHSCLFDYVEFVGEFAPHDLLALEDLARAVETFPHMSATRQAARYCVKRRRAR